MHPELGLRWHRSWPWWCICFSVSSSSALLLRGVVAGRGLEWTDRIMALPSSPAGLSYSFVSLAAFASISLFLLLLLLLLLLGMLVGAVLVFEPAPLPGSAISYHTTVLNFILRSLVGVLVLSVLKDECASGTSCVCGWRDYFPSPGVPGPPPRAFEANQIFA